MKIIFICWFLLIAVSGYGQFGFQSAMVSTESEKEPFLFDRISYSRGTTWVDYGTGTGHYLSVVDNFGYEGRSSVKIGLASNAAENELARGGRYLPTAPSGILDIEFFFCYENIADQMKYMEFRVVHIQDSDSSLYYPKIEYWLSGGLWKFENSSGTMETMISGYNVERYTYWNYARIVVDVVNHEWIKFQINRQEVDLSGEGMYLQGKSPYFQLSKFDFGCRPVGNNNAVTMWLDEVKVYDYVRSKGRLSTDE